MPCFAITHLLLLLSRWNIELSPEHGRRKPPSLPASPGVLQFATAATAPEGQHSETPRSDSSSSPSGGSNTLSNKNKKGRCTECGQTKRKGKCNTAPNKPAKVAKKHKYPPPLQHKNEIQESSDHTWVTFFLAARTLAECPQPKGLEYPDLMTRDVFKTHVSYNVLLWETWFANPAQVTFVKRLLTKEVSMGGKAENARKVNARQKLISNSVSNLFKTLRDAVLGESEDWELSTEFFYGRMTTDQDIKGYIAGEHSKEIFDRYIPFLARGFFRLGRGPNAD
jgi:hypothetical protein